MNENPYKAPQAEENWAKRRTDRSDLEKLGRWLVLLFAGVCLIGAMLYVVLLVIALRAPLSVICRVPGAWNPARISESDKAITARHLCR